MNKTFLHDEVVSQIYQINWKNLDNQDKICTKT